MALAQSRFQEAYTVDASHFADAQRLNEMHFSRIQQHLGYDILEYTEFMHPIPPIGSPFTKWGTQPVGTQPGSSSQPDILGGNEGDTKEDEEEDDDSKEDEYYLIIRQRK